MPNDYEVARAARKGPQIKMGQGGIQHVAPDVRHLPSPSKVQKMTTEAAPSTENKQRAQLAVPVPRTETEDKKSSIEGLTGKYNDRIKLPEYAGRHFQQEQNVQTKI